VSRKQTGLIVALKPVQDRILLRYKAAVAQLRLSL
jgi:hypothetical protein